MKNKRVGIRLTQQERNDIDLLIEAKRYPTISSFIHEAIKVFLYLEKQQINTKTLEFSPMKEFLENKK